MPNPRLQLLRERAAAATRDAGEAMQALDDRETAIGAGLPTDFEHAKAELGDDSSPTALGADTVVCLEAYISPMGLELSCKRVEICLSDSLPEGSREGLRPASTSGPQD